MRFFFAFALPIRTSDAIVAHLDTDPMPAQWRLLPRQGWHLTQLFLGDRDGPVPRELLSELAEEVKEQNAYLLQDGRRVEVAGAGGMQWIRFTPSAEHAQLHNALARRMGVAPDQRHPFWPHVTIARCRKGSAQDRVGAVVVDRLLVDHVALFLSTPTPQGPSYTELQRFPLRLLT